MKHRIAGMWATGMDADEIAAALEVPAGEVETAIAALKRDRCRGTRMAVDVEPKHRYPTKMVKPEARN